MNIFWKNEEKKLKIEEDMALLSELAQIFKILWYICLVMMTYQNYGNYIMPSKLLSAQVMRDIVFLIVVNV